MFSSLVKKIKKHSKNYHNQEDNKSSHVYNFRINVFSTDLISVVFYKRVGEICFA